MNIWIANIKINSISNIGSLNIGKSVLCRNAVKSVVEEQEPLTGEDVTELVNTPITGETADPTAVPPALVASPAPTIRPPPIPPPL